jgi:hypothetical protein
MWKVADGCKTCVVFDVFLVPDQKVVKSNNGLTPFGYGGGKL